MLYFLDIKFGRRPWYPQRYNFEWELEKHCSRDGFYMYQVPLVYMAVFRLVSLEPGPSGPELSVLPTGRPQPFRLTKTSRRSRFIRKPVKRHELSPLKYRLKYCFSFGVLMVPSLPDWSITKLPVWEAQ